jgi:peptide-methionine (S)-S-oxide reductase
VDVVVGYTGGTMKNPTYRNIMDATEAFLVEFDPLVISYERILDEVRNLWLVSI